MIRKEVQIGDCRPTYIYALCEPGGINPRYVGKTQRNFMRRYKEHLSDSLKRAKRLPVNNWIRAIYARGSWVCYKLLETVGPDGDWAQRERYWIAKLRQDGNRLLNLTDGGEGLLGLKRAAASVEAGAEKMRRGAYFDCEQCPTNFYRKRKEIKNGDCRFCSRECYLLWQRGHEKRMPAGHGARGRALILAARRAQTACKRGHPLSGDNLYLNKRGVRVCKECRKEHKRAFRSRHS